jgi:hypothetical protein
VKKEAADTQVPDKTTLTRKLITFDDDKEGASNDGVKGSTQGGDENSGCVSLFSCIYFRSIRSFSVFDPESGMYVVPPWPNKDVNTTDPPPHKDGNTVVPPLNHANSNDPQGENDKTGCVSRIVYIYSDLI